MIRNYLLIALRNHIKRKLSSFINIFGLALGMAVALVLWHYVSFELAYDTHHKKADVLYRVTNSLYSNGEQWPVSGHDLGPSLQNEIPEIRSFIRFHPMYGGAVVSHIRRSGEAVRFRETELQYVDSTILNSFTFEVIFGRLEQALSRPLTAVLTKRMAEKYFGKDVDPVGQIFQVSGYYPGSFQVTAVIDDLPENSHLAFGFLLSIHSLLASDNYRDYGRIENFITYVELDPHATQRGVEAKMESFVKKYAGPNASSNPLIKLQPLLDVHFADGGSISTVYFLVSISIFILLIAWVNYINLSTARAMERSREVGVKKAIGAQRNQLIAQFVFESVLVNLFAIFLAAVLSIPLLQMMGSILNKNLSFDLTSFPIWFRLAGLFVTGSLVSGIYPALILSSFKVKDVIKGRLPGSEAGFNLRKVLVVFQFTASLLLIIGTFVMYKQIRFMQESLGVNSDHILIVKGPMAGEESKNEDRLSSFKNDLLGLAGVKQVATSEAIPGSGYNWGVHANRKGASERETISGQNIDVVFVDPDFFKVYDIPLYSGRSWNAVSSTDMNSVIVNEACISMFGLKDAQHALEETLVFDHAHEAPILGIYKNQHWYSLRDSYKPMALWPQKICSAWYSVVITGQPDESIEAIEKLYQKNFAENPFDYYFHNDFFNLQYNADRQFVKIFGLFAILAIVIACLGLLGLASFATIQRLKEISVRKVLGASVVSIISLLSGQFLRLIAIASLVAIPLSVYGVGEWLDNFSFKISLTWDLFAIPLMMVLFIAWATVSIQIIRGASVNPAKILRSE